MTNFILKFAFALVQGLLSPLNTLINSFIPSLNSAFTYISNFFSYISDYVPFVFSYTGLTYSTLSIIKTVFEASLLLSLGVWSFKTVIKWVSAFR